MIEIHGDYLEGGGQILRTAVALSAVTQKDVRIINIRKGRPNPGLQTQHLEALNAIAGLCDAKVKGNKRNSTEIEFYPKEIKFGSIDIDIPTAGSVGLVLQPIMIAASNAKDNLYISINGGATNGKWAPPAYYIKEVLLGHLSKFGYNASIEIEKYGYYPRGGARVEAVIQKSSLSPIELIELGEIKEIYGVSHASSDLKDKKVAERQAKVAKNIIEERLGIKASIDAVYYNTLNAGSAVEIFAKTDKSIVGADGLGEFKKSAEDVGKEAAQHFLSQLNYGGAVDEYAEDQLLPFMALAAENGESRIKVGKLTDHTKTNIWVIEKFLPVKFEIDGKIIKCRKI